MNIKTIAIIATAAAVAGGIIWAACAKPWKKGEKKNNDNEQTPAKPEEKPADQAAAEKSAEQPAAPAPAPEAPAPEAGNKTDEKK